MEALKVLSRWCARAVPVFSREVDERGPGSPALSRTASGRDGRNDRFVVKAVAMGLARGKNGAAERRVSRRWHTPDRSLP
jgi:hypothetical protein